MKVLAWIVLFLNALVIFYEPFLFGRAREPFGPPVYVAKLIQIAIITALVGRVLLWW